MTARKLAVVAAGIVLAAVAPRAEAQNHLGLFVGPTMATMSGELVESSDIAWGIFVGLAYELELGDKWQLDAEFGLSQKGASRVPFGGEFIDYRLQYMELPITLNRLIPIAGGNWYVSPFAGVSVAMATGCGVRPSATFDYEDCDETTPGGLHEKLDLGVPVGVAFRHRYPRGSAMSVEARYTIGLSSTFDQDGITARNNVMTVLFSFVFPMDRRGYSAGDDR